MSLFRGHHNISLVYVDAAEQFLLALAGAKAAWSILIPPFWQNELEFHEWNQLWRPSWVSAGGKQIADRGLQFVPALDGGADRAIGGVRLKGAPLRRALGLQANIETLRQGSMTDRAITVTVPLFVACVAAGQHHR